MSGASGGLRENGVDLPTRALAHVRVAALACQEVSGCAVFSLGYVLIMAGLAFGGAVALVGFGGLLFAWFHRSLGSPLPLPTLHNASEARLYVAVGTAGVLLWAGAFVCSLRFAP
jgi:hypothetical protein